MSRKYPEETDTGKQNHYKPAKIASWVGIRLAISMVIVAMLLVLMGS